MPFWKLPHRICKYYKTLFKGRVKVSVQGVVTLGGHFALCKEGWFLWSNSLKVQQLLGDCDGFHLHLLVFPFLYQFNSRIGILYRPLPIHHLQITTSKGFPQRFSIISKKFCCGFYMKKKVAFTLISFTVLKWYDCLSVQLPFELPFQISIQLLLQRSLVNYLAQVKKWKNYPTHLDCVLS
jgi:hypothetical protein